MSTATRAAVDSVSHERLLALLAYDRETGLFRWKVGRSWRAKEGSVAGNKAQPGEPIHIGIDGVFYQAHQLAWFYVNGEWAGCELDHKDGDKSNNAISNLRPVDRFGNMQNLRKPHANNRGSKLLGAYKGKRGRWFSTILANGENHYLGTFGTAEEAHAAYVNAKRELHRTCTI